VHAAHGIGLIELAEGDRAEGRAWLERALSFDAGFTPSLNVLGFLELEDGNVDRAGQLFVRALNGDNGSVQARVGLLAATLQRGNLVQAAAMRDELMALDASRQDVRELSAELDRRQATTRAGRAESDVRG
jgi:Tfp pilus assembly protein PilF